MKYKILIIDDDKLLQDSLSDVLNDAYETTVAGSGEAGIKCLKKDRFDLVLLDIRLPGMDGLESLKAIKQAHPETTVIMMTAYEDVKSVIMAMKLGAFDYLIKPLDIDELEVIIEKALENLKLKRELQDIREQNAREFNLKNIIGESEGMKKALEMARVIARSSDTTVLLEGQTGTGKEVIAKAIHYGSDRMNRPFISINCGAISKDLLESELFGYERGTFTGGLQEGKKGKCEIAHTGTLFLDEISELIPAAQVKLLRFLEEKEFYRVGGTEKKKVDVRIIAATNRSLLDEVKARNFREDLFYRLNVAPINLPPLRERRADIMPLVRMFMAQFNEKFGKQFTSISREAQVILLNHSWGGNVRELRNTIERVILMESGREVVKSHLSFLTLQNIPEKENKNSLNIIDANKQLISEALKQTNGNKTRAARLLGISRATLIYRLQKYRTD
jgi:DNA-binding NtrC family response regulator